jgi:hypothetical protein
MRQRLRTAGRAALVAGAAGPLLGVLWWWLAPEIPFDVLDGSVFSAPDTPSDWFGVDGSFLLLGATLGLVVGAVVFARLRSHPVSAALGMTLGCLAAAGVGWWVGRALGPSSISDQVAAVAAGDQVMRPLQVLAPAVLLSPAVAALATYGALVSGTAVVEPDTPSPVSPAVTPAP